MSQNIGKDRGIHGRPIAATSRRAHGGGGVMEERVGIGENGGEENEGEGEIWEKERRGGKEEREYGREGDKEGRM